MKCQNCGENEANVRYTQIINGVKKELALCDECSKKIGLQSLDFNIPINFSSFLGDFLGDTDDYIPNFLAQNTLKCEKCGMTYDEFVEKGKFGCSNCYNVFESKIDQIIKNIQGTNNHIGRRYKLQEAKKAKLDKNIKDKEAKKETINTKQEELQKELKKAIKEERYEDAAKIRDQIKKIK